MQVFSADHPEILLEKYFYLGFLIVIGKSWTFGSLLSFFTSNTP